MKFSFMQSQISLECYFFLLINVRMPTTIVGILIFMARKISCSAKLSRVFFITSGPGGENMNRDTTNQ